MQAIALLLPFFLALRRPPLAGVSTTCSTLEGRLPAPSVFYSGSPEYIEAMSHFSTVNVQQSACVVQPSTQEHVATILNVLSATETPFAVKGGGHQTNPGFSSTTGVHISLKKFSEINYDPLKNVVTVGAGLTWDDVYAALDPLGVGVVGGRATGVGVAGFLLGAGYSFKTNQYGLGVDNVVAYNVVLPDGTAVIASEDEREDLFWALKGGGNNFGIVTSITVKTHAQDGGIWGGIVTYEQEQYPAFAAAFEKFVTTVEDPKASILPTYNWVLGSNGTLLTMLFYDSPTLPPGIFDDFLAIPQSRSDLGTRGMASMVKAGNYSAHISGHRTYFNTVSVRDWTPSVIKLVEEEVEYWGTSLASKIGVFFSYNVEPFLCDHLSHNTHPSAYPPDSVRNPAVATTPMNIFFEWENPAYDADYLAAITETATRIRNLVAQEQGALYEDAPRYNNYAIYNSPLASIYGENLPVLQELKKKYDPNRVMDLTGGWKF